jgi:hypothetical protein
VYEDSAKTLMKQLLPVFSTHAPHQKEDIAILMRDMSVKTTYMSYGCSKKNQICEDT